MKRIIYVLIFLAIIISVFTIVKKRSTPFHVGFIASLSGPLSENGVAGRNGARLAVNKINELGGVHGRMVELVVMDNEADIDVGIKKTDVLIDSFNVPVIFGHFLSMMAPAILPFAEKNVLFVSPLMATSKLSIKDDNFIRFNEPTTVQSRLLIDLLKRNSEWSRIITLYDERNALYSKSIATSIREAVKGMEGRVLLQNLSISEGNLEEFKKCVNVIKEQKPDVIACALNGSDFATMAQLVRKENIDAPFIASRWASRNDMLKHGGVAVEGTIITDNLKSDSQTEECKVFIESYKENYGESPHFVARFSYETVYHTLTTMNEIKDLSPIKIRDAMLAKKTFKGLVKEITLDSLGDGHRGLGLIKVSKGKFAEFYE